MSTVTFIVNKNEKSRKVSLAFSYGFLDTYNGLSDAAVIVTVSNPGYQHVVINIPYLILPDNKTLVFPRPQSNVSYPHILEAGSSCTIWIGLNELKETLFTNGYNGKVQLDAGVDDGSGRKHLTKKSLILNLDVS
ncbi:hypothetical protein [Paenibacillus sp. MZ03-122A]|uniref:hypothetical protein n=1 Tax=Paenibacillus sp. MZ03-122A TaxID=2962033 RepID=UPI0020B65DB7|nr:hypothetical protein [Paenibacillus sp. MZ03-122A]